MPDVEDVAGQVQELLDSWNPPPTDGMMQNLIGVPRPDEAHVQATNSPDDPYLKHRLNPADDSVDAQRINTFADDADDGAAGGAEDYSGDEWSKVALQEEIDSRNADVEDEDNHLSRSGNKDELRDRLIEDDANRRVEDETG